MPDALAGCYSWATKNLAAQDYRLQDADLKLLRRLDQPSGEKRF
jgi:hypothetical protein